MDLVVDIQEKMSTWSALVDQNRNQSEHALHSNAKPLCSVILSMKMIHALLKQLCPPVDVQDQMSV